MKRVSWRTAAYVFMIVACLAWLVPLLFALYVSFRPYAETSQYGYVSLPHTSRSRTMSTPGPRATCCGSSATRC